MPSWPRSFQVSGLPSVTTGVLVVVMPVIVGMFVGVHHRLVAVFMPVMAVGHRLMPVFMLMLVLGMAAHTPSPPSCPQWRSFFKNKHYCNYFNKPGAHSGGCLAYQAQALRPPPLPPGTGGGAPLALGGGLRSGGLAPARRHLPGGPCKACRTRSGSSLARQSRVMATRVAVPSAKSS